MKFELFELPYEDTALTPVISKQTIDFHYGKHVPAYINNLNNLLQGSEYENATLKDIVIRSEGGIFNNSAQVWNHEFYFKTFSPKGSHHPTGALASAIDAAFGNFETFKKEFTIACTALFGSGWVWLSKNQEGNLIITKESNAGNPLKTGATPLLTFDVWEHAYYIDFQNRRADHVNELWNIVDWNIVEKRFEK